MRAQTRQVFQVRVGRLEITNYSNPNRTWKTSPGAKRKKEATSFVLFWKTEKCVGDIVDGKSDGQHNFLFSLFLI